MSRKEEIQNAYQSVGNHTGFYDGMMTYGKSYRLYRRTFPESFWKFLWVREL